MSTSAVYAHLCWKALLVEVRPRSKHEDIVGKFAGVAAVSLRGQNKDDQKIFIGYKKLDSSKTAYLNGLEKSCEVVGGEIIVNHLYVFFGTVGLYSANDDS